MQNITEHVKKRLELSTDLPSLPAVAVEILELAQSPSSTMAQVAEVVSYDPALASKLLRLANSPLYGQRRKSNNIREAVMLLGLNATMMLALSFSLFSTFNQQHKRGLDYNRFWRRSLISSTAARILAKTTHAASPEDAFLAALLQDIGMAITDSLFGDFYLQLEPGSHQPKQLHRHQQYIDMEHRRLGCDHAVIGSWVLQQWNFPARLTHAIAHSHDDFDTLELKAVNNLECCVTLSGPIADALLNIDAQASGHEALDPDRHWLGDSFEPILEALHQEIPVVEALFETSLIHSNHNEELLKKAKEFMLMKGLSSMQELNNGRQRNGSLPPAADTEPGPTDTADTLTGLGSRQHLDFSLIEEFSHAQSNKWPLSLILIDLDKFKLINDRLGHALGDEILKLTAKVLSAHCRNQDALFRFGGDEYAILLPGCDDDAALATCKRILTAIRKTPHKLPSNKRLTVTCSAGISCFKAHNFDSPEALVQAAETSLYRAQHSGGDQAFTERLHSLDNPVNQ